MAGMALLLNTNTPGGDMKVKMLEDAPGSPDGVTVNEYAEGVVYDVPEDLGATFVNLGLAVEDETDAESELEPVEEPDGADTDGLTKKIDGPSENK